MPACSQTTDTVWKSVLMHLSPSAFGPQFVAEESGKEDYKHH